MAFEIAVLVVSLLTLMLILVGASSGARFTTIGAFMLLASIFGSVWSALSLLGI